eukprot:c15828_g1_i1 orf=1146-1415(+)
MRDSQLAYMSTKAKLSHCSKPLLTNVACISWPFFNNCILLQDFKLQPNVIALEEMPSCCASIQAMSASPIVFNTVSFCRGGPAYLARCG